MAVHQPSRLSPEEKIGVVVAIALHAGLVAWLVLAPSRSTFQAPPERMTVSLSDEVALEATSPEPMAQAAPEIAPTLGEAAPEPEPLPVVTPPEPQPRVVASPLPRPAPPVAKPTPRPLAKPSPRPAPPVSKPSAKPVAKPIAKAPAKPAAATDSRARRRPDAPAGASRVGNDFLKGIPGGEARGVAQTPPATRVGPQVAASLRQAVARQLQPNWVAPQGAEVELLRTTISWSLNSDGSLSGSPQLASQEGLTDANRAQAKRHVEQAIRAIRLAAPFDLPEQYYGSWKRLRFTFDRNLSR